MSLNKVDSSKPIPIRTKPPSERITNLDATITGLKKALELVEHCAPEGKGFDENNPDKGGLAAYAFRFSFSPTKEFKTMPKILQKNLR
jgi:hypothetical protein